MTEPNSKTALRLALEGFVVVLSILIAFGLDAWWGRAELRRDVLDDLQNVRREVEANRSLVAFHLDLGERVAVTNERAMAILEAESGQAAVVLPDTVAWLMWVSSTFDPYSGAIDALITSGRMAAIADPELRLALGELEGRFSDLAEDEHLVRDMYSDVQGPLMYGAIDVRPIVGVADRFWAGERVPGRPLEFAQDVAYPNSLAIRNVLRERLVFRSVALGELRAIGVELDRIIELIDSAS